MKFQIQPHHAPIDPVSIRDAILAVDDTAQVELDVFSGKLLVLAFLDDADVVRILRAKGYTAEPLRAKDCCGSCG